MLAIMMRTPHTLAATVLTGALLFPFAAFAKRAAPKPVPPVVDHGVEYRAKDMNFVEAVDLASHARLWRTKVYFVWYVPLAEQDCQDIFITTLAVQNGRLLVRNEAGRTYRVDLRTGHVEGAIRYWLPWFVAGVVLLVLLVVTFFAWMRAGEWPTNGLSQ